MSLLVNAYTRSEDELRADLQQYYGIDLDYAMAGGHTPHHIACLVEHLPQDARLFVKRDSDCAWRLEHVLAANVANSLNALIYGMSDPKKRGAEPKLIGPRKLVDAQKRKLPARVVPVDKLIEELSKPRR